jgi:hypothetical protein
MKQKEQFLFQVHSNLQLKSKQLNDKENFLSEQFNILQSQFHESNNLINKFQEKSILTKNENSILETYGSQQKDQIIILKMQLEDQNSRDQEHIKYLENNSYSRKKIYP